MISIFTPSHNASFLPEILRCLQAQSCVEWEWIVLLNGGAEWETDDSRVRIYRHDGDFPGVGALKRRCCELANGDILLELDHDDLLFPGALQRVEAEFRNHPKACMAYSDCAYVNPDWTPHVWGTGYGWEYYDADFDGHAVRAIREPEPWPQNLSRIWYAPDHLRAWRTSAYLKIGGHDPALRLADDHDLICRSYLHGEIRHISECLYLYRKHGNNTWLQNVDEIQAAQWRNYDRYIYPLAETWAQREGLLKIDLCGAIDKAQGYVSIDRQGEISCDLDERWALPDNSIGVLRAHDAIEHLRDPIHTMNEAWRVLAHGGFFLISVPSALGEGGFCDPTHRSFWVKRSFRYYTEAAMQRYIAGSHCRFQVLKVEDAMKWEGVPYVNAHLIALKDGPRFHGVVKI